VQAITLTFPWPDMSKASIHGDGNWIVKSRWTKTARDSAMYLAKDQATGINLKKATIRYYFFVPDNRRRDEANMIQMCKPMIDGITDARVIAGDHWQVLKIAGVVVAIDNENPRVEIEISEVV